MRFLFACLLIGLLSWSSALAGLETPLVMQAPNGRLTAVVNPTAGTIQIYEVSGDRLVQRSTTNYLVELDFKRIAPADIDRPEWRQLQVGSAFTSPTYAEMLSSWFPEQLDVGANAEPPTFSQRVVNTEREFWADPPTYDGVIAGAVGDDSLVLAIPSLYTLMFFFIDGWDIRLVGTRNYRTELYIPQVFGSYPTPQEILKALPEDVQDAHKEGLAEQFEAMGPEAGQKIHIGPSEVWLANISDGGTDTYVLLDHANERLMTYEMRARGRNLMLNLKSARNIAIDLMIPSTYNSRPHLYELVEDYNRKLQRAKLPLVSHGYLRKLAGVRAIEGQGTSDIQANVDADGRLVIDFSKQRQLLVYEPRGRSNQLELKAVRDYTLEIGIGIHHRQIREGQQGEELAEYIENLCKRRKSEPDKIISLVELAFQLNPNLYEAFEKNRRIRGKLEDHARWQPLIDQALAESKRRAEEHEAIMEALKREEEERRNGG